MPKTIAPAKHEPTIQELHDRLKSYVEELYANARFRVKPSFPFVMVRVLEREKKIGRIITPEVQKKTTIEGIVLDVFKPFWRRLATSSGSTTDGTAKSDSQELLIEASVKPGDHVLLPHYEGVPVPVDDYNGDFRLVPSEYGFYGKERQGILGVLEYAAQDTTDWLTQFLKDAMVDCGRDCGTNEKVLAERLMAKAEIFPHNRESQILTPRASEAADKDKTRNPLYD